MTSRLFSHKGIHVLADGSFGSTGKGAFASFLATEAHEEQLTFAGCITSAGPNSGHTFYHDGEKHVLKQLPSFAVKTYLMGGVCPVIFSAGAIVDPQILAAEMAKYPDVAVFIDGRAAVVRPEDKEAEHSGSVAAVAGTRSGAGAALARKVLRDPMAVYEGWLAKEGHKFWSRIGQRGPREHKTEWLAPWAHRYMMEISQGFSLGLNSQFYPKVTSRECTFMQGMSDARCAPIHYQAGYLVFRTFPIRVGNVGGYDSGGWYPDQRELSWDEVGVEPERTTVTNRQRRVATFSWRQYVEAIRANSPTCVVLNFWNYLKDDEKEKFKEEILWHRQQYVNATGHYYDIFFGTGPGPDDFHRYGGSRESYREGTKAV
jgi:adenylosuccinate synthase